MLITEPPLLVAPTAVIVSVSPTSGSLSFASTFNTLPLLFCWTFKPESLTAFGAVLAPTMATVTVAGHDPVLYELPHGIGVAELLAHHGVAGDSVRGALLGGYFAGLVNREVLDATVDHAGFAAIGSGLGCGAIALITDECPVAVAASVLEYFGRENAGQCGSCFNGTAAMAAVAVALREHTADAEDLARLRRWSQVLRGRGACGTLDAATNIAASLLNKFGADVDAHLEKGCAVCAGGIYVAERPFEVEAR